MSLNGVDIANYQAGINIAAMTTTDFVIVKATQGTWYTSPSFVKQYSDAKAAGKLLIPNQHSGQQFDFQADGSGFPFQLMVGKHFPFHHKFFDQILDRYSGQGSRLKGLFSLRFGLRLVPVHR